MNSKNENYWLLEAPVSKAIWHMAIPMMLGMSVNMIYNLTDTFFIGKLNDTHTAICNILDGNWKFSSRNLLYNMHST